MVDEFNECAVSRKKCVPKKSGVGEFPVPSPNVLVKSFNTSYFNLDEDLQGIDIAFDEEESDSVDNLSFLQLDDNLQQSAPVIVEQSSPHSIVEETESDAADSSQFSNIDENVQSEFSSKMSGSRPDMSLTHESSVSSDRKYGEQADDTKIALQAKVSGGYDSATTNSSFPVPPYNNPPAFMQLPVDSRICFSEFLFKEQSPTWWNCYRFSRTV
ncbi:hypothetical protein KIW84_042446 [Lathyrus oleraceus]|uniref:VDE lipocalin domain-containing protein n=1 Tax=Pisum sativum TaxID=3888 RepID=A0A9D4XCZ8_PEA|nr:hypothetical protein KIW84_042446 [Pisum sativum]